METKDGNRDYVLIDDDSLIHEIWRASSTGRNVNIRCFSHPDQFLEIADTVSPDTTIYIDLFFKEGPIGLEYATKLVELGFKKVFLSTGSDPRPSLPDGIRQVPKWPLPWNQT